MKHNRSWKIALAIVVGGLSAGTVHAESKCFGPHSDGYGNWFMGTKDRMSACASYDNGVADSYADKQLKGRFLVWEKTLASARFEAHSAGGSSGRVSVGGKTVFASSVSSSRTLRLNQTVQPLVSLSGGFSVGVASLKGSLELGGGAQFSESWNLRSSPARAYLDGAVQTWGFGKAEIKGKVGPFSGGIARADVAFNNSTLHNHLTAARGRTGESTARYDRIGWAIKVKAFGIKLINSSASPTSVAL